MFYPIEKLLAFLEEIDLVLFFITMRALKMEDLHLWEKQIASVENILQLGIFLSINITKIKSSIYNILMKMENEQLDYI